jgi:predicted DNA-binding transcriptional regulator YafY
MVLHSVLTELLTSLNMNESSIEPSPSISFSPLKIRLKVTPSVKAALERFPLSNDQTIKEERGAFIAETEMLITPDLIHWIYASSNDVEVLAPLQLREIVRTGISSALEQYRLV